MSNTLFLQTSVRDAPAPASGAALGVASRRPVVYDMTHLIARLRANTGTGIDRIDLAYASHFFSAAEQGRAARYGSATPRLIDPGWAKQFTRAAQDVWTKAQSRQAEAMWTWLASPPSPNARPQLQAPSRHSAPAWGRRLLSWTGYLVGSARRAVPPGAVYINVGYHRFEHPRFFAWLADRPDVAGVFMIHDLLPLDYPEYFEPGEARSSASASPPRCATAARSWSRPKRCGGGCNRRSPRAASRRVRSGRSRSPRRWRISGRNR